MELRWKFQRDAAVKKSGSRRSKAGVRWREKVSREHAMESLIKDTAIQTAPEPPREGEASTPRINRMRSKAAERGIDWRLTDSDYAKAIGEGICHWCSGSTSSNGVGLDRIDNRRGYEVGNVLSCCFNCNMERRTLSFAEYTAVWEVRRLVERGVSDRGIRDVASTISKKVLQGRLHHDRSARVSTAQFRPEPEWKQLLQDRAHKRECGLDPESTLPVRLEGETDSEFRARLGITQKQFAKLIDMSRRTIQRIEQAHKRGGVRKLRRIAAR
jgi:hypothetical protein